MVVVAGGTDTEATDHLAMGEDRRGGQDGGSHL